MSNEIGTYLVNAYGRSAAEDDFLCEHRLVRGYCLFKLLDEQRARSRGVQNDDNIQRLHYFQQGIECENFLVSELLPQRMRSGNIQFLDFGEVRFADLLVDICFLECLFVKDD